jgi:hypothetical protein
LCSFGGAVRRTEGELTKIKMQLTLFNKPQVKNKEQILTDLFSAYYHARKNKRNTINQLKFEVNYEQNLLQLFDEIINYKYKPARSICFIVNNPVKREIFAADFRDRVIHHLIYNYISPIFEKSFINESYSCRIAKGTHYGIKRIDHFIRSCSQNYTKSCYILKLDIKGYFMAMNKTILYNKIEQTLHKFKHKINFDLPWVLYLIEQTIFNDSTLNCIVKGKKSDWAGLPKSKSLFHSKCGCGLPIGNLTSQLFGNIYLNEFDHWVKKSLGIKYYGRYVDDFILIHENKEYLKSLIEPIRKYLKDELHLTLHPNKIYLQHYSKGVKYLGAVIKPHRIYVANRTKGNFYKTIEKQNKLIEYQVPTKNERKDFESSMNSYLGIMHHYKTFNLLHKFVFKKLDKKWFKYFYLTGGLFQFKAKKTIKK